MRTFSGSDQFNELQKVVIDSYSKVFPVEKAGFKLELDKMWLDDSAADPHDYTSQKKTKLAGRTWGANLLAGLVLKDPTGKVIDRMSKIRLATIPRITPRGSYIVGGNEYQVANQMIRKPGAYVVRSQKGDTFKGMLALTGDRQQNFEIHFDPTDNKYKVKLGQGFIPLYPLVKALGATDKELIGAWGEKIFLANKAEQPKHYLKLADKLARTATDNQQTAIEALQAYAKTAKVDPNITKITTGSAHETLSRGLLIDTSKKILGVYQGKVEPDDPENLLFKEIRSVEDMLQDRLGSKKEQDGLKRMLSHHLGRKNSIKQLINFKKLTAPVESFFTADNRTSTPEQYNPVHMVAEQNKLTVHGTGGITSAHAVSTSLREVHPSHIGFVDPIHTPESAKTGTTLHLASAVVKDGRNVRTIVRNVKTGKTELLTPQELFFKTVAFPDELEDGKFKNPTGVRAQSQGKVSVVPAAKVDYALPHPTTLFSRSTNLVPFLKNDQGNRAMMAAKMLGQALPLVEREAPLVQTAMPHGETFHDEFGKNFSIHAPHDGKVTAVGADHIMVGKTKIPLYNNFPLNQKTHLHHTPKVNVGDSVKKGQLLADSNFTKNGSLAIGKNLSVAYLPYPGYTFEDGIVITESAAKKLSAEQTYRHAFKLEPGRKEVGLRRFLSYYPTAMTKEQAGTFDVDGVVKKGARVKPGQILITGMTYAAHSPENMTLRRINKALSLPWSDSSVKYTGEFEGVVTDVVKRGDQVDVFVKSIEPAKESDKLAGVHGNKGVITKIIPDHEAPRTKDGHVPDVFLNPHGIIGRINVGQIYESAAGKIARKTGKPFVVSNFDNKDTNKHIQAELQKHGLSDVEEMVTPDGKPLGKVHVGNPYILRLAKTGKTGFSARMPGQGYDVNLQPVKGGEEGAKSLDQLTFFSMLSHGAKKNLLDAHMKSERNDEFWHAIETGKIPPSPQPSFAFNKFIGLLQGAGINVNKKGSEFVLAPMTDKDTLKLSRGAIKDARFLYGKNNAEIKNGFFDTAITGGLQGKNYAHLELPEHLPNPVFETAIKSLTGLKGPQYEQIVSGRLYVTPDGKVTPKADKGTKTGGQAIAHMLSRIDVDGDITKYRQQIRKTKSELEIDKLNRKIRYLTALKELNLTPQEAYIRKTVPVVPPVYRPIQEVPGRGRLVAPPNFLYQNLGILSEMHDQPVMKLLEDEEKTQLREATYKATRAVAGLEDVLTRGKEQPYKGFISQITSTQPKQGFFLNKLITKKQDLVGRGVITNGPDLHMDELGIPEKMARTIFRPFTVREFTQAGYRPDVARKHIDDNTPLAKQMLESAMKKRTVLMNRAPSLHKFSIMAFKPKLSDGLAVKVPPLVFKGMNADVDGDCQVNTVICAVADDVASTLVLTYGQAWVDHRIVSARFKEIVPHFRHKTVLVLNLSEFPKAEFQRTVQGENGPIHFYRVPDGVEVVAYDEVRKQPVLAKATLWSEHPGRQIEVVTLQSGRQIVSDNDPRAVYGSPAGTSVVGRFRPKDAVAQKVLVPRVTTSPDAEQYVSELPTLQPLKENSAYHALPSTLPVNADLGYFLGVLCGDGWVDPEKGVNLASITSEIAEAITAYLNEICPGLQPYRKTRDAAGYGDVSIKYSYPSTALARTVSPLIGRGAANKHLPPFYLNASREFREGLLAGLIDTDGSVQLAQAKEKNKPQLMAAFSTNSLRLAQEITLLARSLGIRSGLVSAKTPLGKPCWAVNFSNYDFKHKLPAELLRHPSKRQNLLDGEVNETPALVRHDLVPAPRSLLGWLRTRIGASRKASKEQKCLYQICHKAYTVGYITRRSAKALCFQIGLEVVLEHPEGKWWAGVIEDTSVTWDPVVSFEKTGIAETGYDLTVPGYETFMAIDGTILSNTVSLHVPVSEEALKESTKMFPSNNLWKPGTGELMTVPSQESALGLYFLSQTDKGRAEINRLIPAKYAVTAQLTAKTAKDLYEHLAKDLPQQFPNIVHEMKLLGDKHAYETGFTAGVADLNVSTKARDAIFRRADAQAQKIRQATKPGPEQDNKIASIYEKAAQEAYGHVKKDLKEKGSSFYHMVASGARGKDSQLMQMTSAPGIVLDAKDRKVPVPIKKSYAEGVTTSDYFMAAYGVRKGMMDRSLQTEKPGATNKDVMASVADHLVSDVDCGTKRGLDLPLTNELTGRFLANDQHGLPRNTQVTPQVISLLGKKGIRSITVRSPLRCLSPKGVCAHCFGHDENGHLPQVGDNVGAKSGQTMTEPMTQFVMRCTVSNVICKYHDQVYSRSMEDMWHIFEGPVTCVGKVETKAIAGDAYIWDMHGWKKILQAQRHPPEVGMRFLKTKSGDGILVQDDHPMFVYSKPACVCGQSQTALRFENKGYTVSECPKCKRVVTHTKASLSETEQVKEVRDVAEGQDWLWICKNTPKHSCASPGVDPYILGFYLAEGCIRKDPRYPDGTAILLSQKQKLFLEYVLAKAVASGYNAHQDANGVAIYDTRLAPTFGRLAPGHAHDKRMNFEFYFTDKTWLGHMVAGMIDGDGSVGAYKGNSNIIKYYTSSFVLAQQLTMVCKVLGLPYSLGLASISGSGLAEHTTQPYAVEIRLTDEAKRWFSQSLKVQSVEANHKEYSKEPAVFGPSVVTSNKAVLTRKDLYTYDFATESEGFVGGFIRNHNTFHTGGVSSSAPTAKGFERVAQLLNMPKYVAGEASLAQVDGKVTKIAKSPAGGFDIYVGTQVHTTRPGLTPTVKVGTTVNRGDKLTDGVLRPQEILKHKGMLAAQNYVVDELKNTYEQQGVPMNRKIFETVLRATTNTTRVVEAPKHSNFLPGDVIPYTTAMHYNETRGVRVPLKEAAGYFLKESVGKLPAMHEIADKDLAYLRDMGHGPHIDVLKDPLIHAPMIKGITQVPALRKDWMAQLGYRYLQRSLTEGAAQAWKSNVEGSHPVPAFAFGASMGKKKEHY